MTNVSICITSFLIAAIFALESVYALLGSGEFRAVSPELFGNSCAEVVNIQGPPMAMIQPTSLALDGKICTGEKTLFMEDLFSTLKGVTLGLFFSKAVRVTVRSDIQCGEHILPIGTELLFVRFSNPKAFLFTQSLVTGSVPLLRYLKYATSDPRVELTSYAEYLISSAPCLWENLDIGNESPFPSTSMSPSPPPSVSASPSVSPSLSASPSETTINQDEEPEETSESDRSCFPGSATVRLLNGQVERIGAVKTGDEVHVGDGKYDRIFGWTHHSEQVRGTFVRIFCDKESPLIVTGSHYLYRANHSFVIARNVMVGDTLLGGDGKPVLVKRIDRVQAEGLFNPQTLGGDIVVNDFWVSTFTAAVRPINGHALLLPVRAVFILHRMCTVGE